MAAGGAPETDGGGDRHLFDLLYRAQVQDDVADPLSCLADGVESETLKLDGSFLKSVGTSQRYTQVCLHELCL